MSLLKKFEKFKFENSLLIQGGGKITCTDGVRCDVTCGSGNINTDVPDAGGKVGDEWACGTVPVKTPLFGAKIG